MTQIHIPLVIQIGIGIAIVIFLIRLGCKTVDRERDEVLGRKVKLVYHETLGKNWFGARGGTNHFITNVQVLDRNFGNQFNNSKQGSSGHVIDTVYVVLDKSQIK
jgi:hypothetical protein